MAQCQCCNKLGVEVFDICEDCGWQNDDTFEINHSDDNIQVVPVGYVLTKAQRQMWSSANGDTVDAHYQRWIDNGKQIKYQWE